MELDLARELERLEKFGKLEHLIRGLIKDIEFWTVTEVQTGEKAVPAHFSPTTEDVLTVLGGDHVLTLDFKVITITPPKVVQEVKEMKEFYGDWWGEGKGRDIADEMFVTFPTPEKFVYTWKKAESVFDSNGKVEKLVTYFPEGKKIGVWTWNNHELKKDYFFEFKAEINRVVSLPRQTRISDGNEVAVVFLNSVVIFDITTGKRLRKIKMEYLADWEIFTLPNGHLAVKWGQTLNEEMRVLVLDLFETLNIGNKEYSVVKIEPVDDAEGSEAEGKYTFMPESYDMLVFPAEKGFYVLSGAKDEHFQLLRTSSGQSTEVSVDGKFPKASDHSLDSTRGSLSNEFCSCIFHGTDLALVKEKPSKRIIIEGRPSEKNKWQLVFAKISEDGKLKSRQTLGLPIEVSDEPFQHLPGNRYILKFSNRRRVLLEYSPETDMYSLGPKVDAHVLLPTSMAQKKVMGCFVDDLFVEVKAPVPKEVVGIVAGFI